MAVDTRFDTTRARALGPTTRGMNRALNGVTNLTKRTTTAAIGISGRLVEDLCLDTLGELGLVGMTTATRLRVTVTLDRGTGQPSPETFAGLGRHL